MISSGLVSNKSGKMENTLMWKEVVFFGLRSSITGIGRPFFLSKLIIVVGGINLALGGVAPFLFAHLVSFFSCPQQLNR